MVGVRVDVNVAAGILDKVGVKLSTAGLTVGVSVGVRIDNVNVTVRVLLGIGVGLGRGVGVGLGQSSQYVSTTPSRSYPSSPWEKSAGLLMSLI